MTTAPAQPSRTPLGRGVSSLIPQFSSPDADTPAAQAAAALTALRTVPIQAGALQAAIALLDAPDRMAADPQALAAAAATVKLLRAALQQAAPRE
ncbi:hypothetical protein [Streptomyces rimosus]|uniref:hypothetical protein n=1 Tax=Streptomyces rimosus TaxID=1927 RepID=UPI0006B2A47C|nr:hypothetical protein [Streptomyces rimosus]